MLTTTIIFTGILLAIQTVLSIAASAHRAKYDIDFGDEGNETMLRAIRAHGNFIEYVPILLIAIGISEFIGAPGWFVWTCGWALVISRISHATYMLGYAGKPARLIGATLTLVLMTVFAVYLIGRGTGLIA